MAPRQAIIPFIETEPLMESLPWYRLILPDDEAVRLPRGVKTPYKETFPVKYPASQVETRKREPEGFRAWTASIRMDKEFQIPPGGPDADFTRYENCNSILKIPGRVTMAECKRNPPAFLATLLLLLLCAPAALAINIRAGDPAPDFSLADLDGKVITLSDYRGKAVLLVFWSTWCARCLEELTFLRDNYGGRADVAVILVNQDSEKTVSTKRIAEIRNRLSIPFPIIEDIGLSMWDRFGIQALPSSMVIGRDGRVILVEPNFYWGTPEKLLQATSGD
jgi:peroxiredoxin